MALDAVVASRLSPVRFHRVDIYEPWIATSQSNDVEKFQEKIAWTKENKSCQLSQRIMAEPEKAVRCYEICWVPSYQGKAIVLGNKLQWRLIC
jgi:hypothetical protein